MRRRAVAVMLLAAPMALSAQQPAEPFPHARHARLFPTCAGCHAGVTSGDAARVFPPPASCASCHDGTIQKRVEWATPRRTGAGFLTFSHPTHAARAKDATCTSCHAAEGAAWMTVAAAAPDRCGSCHAHASAPHLAAANACTTCHRPLAEATALTDARVAALPTLAGHDAPDFVGAHGAAATANGAQCATCHARQSCARCHVDAARSPSIQALKPDARVARAVAGKAPSYPAPASHAGTDFAVAHAAAARAATANCATCHARSSCATCHTGDGARAVLQGIPADADGGAPGVQLRHALLVPPAGGASLAAWMPQAHGPDTTRLVRVHAPGFSRSHGPAASSGALQCASCHATAYCATCHAGEKVTRAFHPANFVATHAPQAYGRDTDCSACHSTQAFCRSCHLQAGLAVRSSTQRSPTFHNRQPLWLLLHGRAARQDLPSCTTCHQQTYCMQCHSQLGARINPHGPGFDAARMASRNTRICLACHFKDPLPK